MFSHNSKPVVKADRHVTFQLPDGYELDESPLPSSSQLPALFPPVATATSSPPRSSPPRPSPPRPSPTRDLPAKLPSPAEETSHLPVAAIRQASGPVVPSPPMGQVYSTSLTPLPPVVTKPTADAQAAAVIPPIPSSIPHPYLNPVLRPGKLACNMLYDTRLATGDAGTLTSYQREQAATNPAVQRMLIMPFLPIRGVKRRLFVVSTASSPTVSVANVLEASSEWLLGQIDKETWDLSSPVEKQIASTAFWIRVSHTRAEEKDRVRAAGVRRIDYFGDRTFFGGLTPMPNQPEIWQLDLVSGKAKL